MNNKYLIELLKLIKEVNFLTDKDTKMDKVHHISTYGAYLYYIGAISNNDFTNAIMSIKNDIEDLRYYEERKVIINNLLDNNLLLYDAFVRNLSCYWKYIIKEKKDNINIDIEKEFIDFLKYINCYDLYHNIKENDKISYQSNILKHSICLDDRDQSYIIIKSKNSFYEYLDLSHEIAHALENKLLAKYKRCFDSPFNSEILSITFNRMFIEYLYWNNKISKEEYLTILGNFETNYFYFIRSAIFISDSIKSGNYKIYDYDINIFCDDKIDNRSLTDYNYAIGRICAFKLINEWMNNDHLFIKNIPNLVDDLYHSSIKELLDNYGNNSPIIEKELSKNFIKR